MLDQNTGGLINLCIAYFLCFFLSIRLCQLIVGLGSFQFRALIVDDRQEKLSAPPHFFKNNSSVKVAAIFHFSSHYHNRLMLQQHNSC
jgi:hypothetical protein